MNLPHLDVNVRAGMVGGTLLSILANIHYSDVLRTSILAAIGAVVSFLVTILLKFLIKKIKKVVVPTLVVRNSLRPLIYQGLSVFA